MGVQVYDRRFKPQPWNVSLGGVAPDCRWSWEGLILAWPMWGSLMKGSFLRVEDPIRGRLGATGGDRYMVSDVHGPALYGEFVSGSVGLVSVASSAFLPTTECTVVYQKRRRDGNSSFINGMDVSCHGLGDSRLGVYAPLSDGTTYFDFGGASEGSTRLSVAGLTFGDNVWVASTGPRGMEIWQDGRKVASNAATPTRSASSGPWGIGYFDFGGFSQPDNANYGVLLLYDRQLSPGAIQKLSRDPWTPVRPDRRRLAGVFQAPPSAGPRFRARFVG